ncbi:MAG: hypothetical protein U5P41_10830 [Gammaproteobacteria bacterium]|nr:hypothetical protein [Gammaproteobacteria bacterium]
MLQIQGVGKRTVEKCGEDMRRTYSRLLPRAGG